MPSAADDVSTATLVVVVVGDRCYTSVPLLFLLLLLNALWQYLSVCLSAAATSTTTTTVSED